MVGPRRESLRLLVELGCGRRRTAAESEPGCPVQRRCHSGVGFVDRQPEVARSLLLVGDDLRQPAVHFHATCPGGVGVHTGCKERVSELHVVPIDHEHSRPHGAFDSGGRRIPDGCLDEAHRRPGE